MLCQRLQTAQEHQPLHLGSSSRRLKYVNNFIEWTSELWGNLDHLINSQNTVMQFLWHRSADLNMKFNHRESLPRENLWVRFWSDWSYANVSKFSDEFKKGGFNVSLFPHILGYFQNYPEYIFIDCRDQTRLCMPLVLDAQQLLSRTFMVP